MTIVLQRRAFKTLDDYTSIPVMMILIKMWTMIATHALRTYYGNLCAGCIFWVVSFNPHNKLVRQALVLLTDEETGLKKDIKAAKLSNTW